MVDREKLIKGLECCIKMNSRLDERYCDDCPYNYQSDGTCASLSPLLEDALALLKEQNPVIVYESKNSECTCKNTVNRYWHPKFCGFCGKELIWYQERR